ncbi:hypothetical protein [Planctomyces sp. SH-PL62]|uniref:hypothetical protein n=1 Tax=Planctomyces sp. SH-PL62 TaxID=1636152 RepID=UPI00078D59D8|nr:hypothetical protein [Planctomyces sp. SH-PL62]AMV40131.1 hypothetical protein VT85_22045 [Planctomyces sp. SH-PL62]
MTRPVDPDFEDPMADKIDKRTIGPSPLEAWCAVFMTNLVVPLGFGMSTTNLSGKIGMLGGILVLFGLGWRTCSNLPGARSALIYGGWIVAAAQLFPIVHLTAGMMGVAAARAAQREFIPIITMLGGFLATVVTGGILISLAFVIGLVRPVSPHK